MDLSHSGISLVPSWSEIKDWDLSNRTKILASARATNIEARKNGRGQDAKSKSVNSVLLACTHSKMTMQKPSLREKLWFLHPYKLPIYKTDNVIWTLLQPPCESNAVWWSASRTDCLHSPATKKLLQVQACCCALVRSSTSTRCEFRF